jgi:hypothetical protein
MECPNGLFDGLDEWREKPLAADLPAAEAPGATSEVAIDSFARACMT